MQGDNLPTEFIQKRIREQLQYIREVLDSNKPDDRKRELVESAAGVLNILMINYKPPKLRGLKC